MGLKIKNRYPGIAVVLYKNVGRARVSGTGPAVSTRYSGQQSVIDVTPFLGEQGSVRVDKSVRAPAGEFTIDFMDKLVQVADDSMYGIFEPMDLVEIYMTANAYQYSLPSGQVSYSVDGQTTTSPPAVSHLPIMMRGFISHVSRSMSMGSDGKPVRKVTIAGEDYGKIWQMLHIYNNPWMQDGNYITSFKLFTRFGVGFGIETAGAFVSEILTKIINPFIDQMTTNAKAAVGGNSPLKNIQDAVQTPGGSIFPFGTNNWAGGSIYELLTQYGDTGEWNELYIEDQKDGPYLVYRPNPWLTAGGDPSNAGAYINGNDPSKIKVNSITMDDVFSIDVTRTDRHVANYFWVESPAYDLSFDVLGKALAAQGARNTFILDTYGNCDPSLYGFKRMMAQTNQGSPLVSGGNGTPKPINDRDAGLTRTWIQDRRTALAESNKDNVVFETGTMRIAGNENVKAGSYLMVTHGNMTSAYYVVAVTHNFVPFGQYSTMVTFERGTGFIDRVQKGGGAASPYWAELADAQK